MVNVATMATETTVPVQETVTRTTRVVNPEALSGAREKRQFRATLKSAWDSTIDAGKRATGAVGRGARGFWGWIRRTTSSAWNFVAGTTVAAGTATWNGTKWVGNRLYWSGAAVGRGIGRVMRFFARSGLTLLRGTTRFLERTMSWTARVLSALLRDALFTGFATVFVIALGLILLAAGMGKLHDSYQKRVHEPVRRRTAQHPSTEPDAMGIMRDTAETFARSPQTTTAPEPHGATATGATQAPEVLVETTETTEKRTVESMSWDDAAATMQEGDPELDRLITDESHGALETFLRGVTGTAETVNVAVSTEEGIEKTNLDGTKTKFTRTIVESPDGESITIDIPDDAEWFGEMQAKDLQDGELPNWHIPLDLNTPIEELQSYYELMMMRYSKLPLPVEPEPGFWLGRRFDEEKMRKGWSYWQGRFFCLQLWARLGDGILDQQAAEKFWQAKRKQLAAMHLFTVPRQAEWHYDEKTMYEGFMSEYNRIIEAINWRNTALEEGRITDEFTFGTYPENEALKERQETAKRAKKQPASAGRGPRGGRSGNPARGS